MFTFLARMHTPVGPNAAVHRLFGLADGGLMTVPLRKSPDPRSVIPSVRMITAWWYTPGFTRTVSPGWAWFTAAWMDCPGPTTMTLVTDDAAAACGTPSATPSAIAGAAKINLRMTTLRR